MVKTEIIKSEQGPKINTVCNVCGQVGIVTDVYKTGFILSISGTARIKTCKPVKDGDFLVVRNDKGEVRKMRKGDVNKLRVIGRAIESATTGELVLCKIGS